MILEVTLVSTLSHRAPGSSPDLPSNGIKTIDSRPALLPCVGSCYCVLEPARFMLSLVCRPRIGWQSTPSNRVDSGKFSCTSARNDLSHHNCCTFCHKQDIICISFFATWHPRSICPPVSADDLRHLPHGHGRTIDQHNSDLFLVMYTPNSPILG